MSGRKAQPSTALARSEKHARQVAVIRERNRKISRNAAKVVLGLFESPVTADGEPNKNYNPDAEKTRSQCSMKTWASLEIWKQDKAAEREDKATARELGVVLAQAKLSRDDWQAQADHFKREGSESAPNKPVIDDIIDIEVATDAVDET